MASMSFLKPIVGRPVLLAVYFAAFMIGSSLDAAAQSVGGNPMGSFKRGFNILLGIAFIIASFMAVWWVIDGARHMRRGDSEGANNAFIAAAIAAGADLLVGLIWNAFGKNMDLQATP